MPAPGRFQDRGYGHTAGVGQSFVVNHLFAQWNDEADSQESSGNSAKRQQDGVEIGAITEDENGRH